MPNVIAGYRITGAEDAQGRVHNFSNDALQEIRKQAQRRARQTVLRFKEEMGREYTSAWATGMLARGITFKTAITGNGVDIQFFIQDRRELRYVTAALGGHFQRFPVGPFVIRPTGGGKALSIRFPSSLARQFIRGKNGTFAGSRGGRSGIVVKSVLWGKRTGGFSRDVISEVAEEEGALFVQDMTRAVEKAVVKMTT